MKLSPEEQNALCERAMRFLNENKRVIDVVFDVKLAMIFVGQLQLALRHPKNTGPARDATENVCRILIEQIDPTHGDLWQMMMLGFDRDYDQTSDEIFPEYIEDGK